MTLEELYEKAKAQGKEKLEVRIQFRDSGGDYGGTDKIIYFVTEEEEDDDGNVQTVLVL